MRFTWDDNKNRLNFKKHGVWFEEAQTVWLDSQASEFFDPDHSESEDRFLRVGYSAKNDILVVVFCERHGGIIRIIPARKATLRERMKHEEGI